MDPREYERSFLLEWDHWWFRAKRALVHSLLARYAPPRGRGLDLGCGTGGMLRGLAEESRGGWTWVGADREWLALALSRRRGLARLVGASALSLPFRAGSFDACLCLDVLYHREVASETAALAECHRVLRAEGLLLVTDSALAWLRSGHDEAVHGARRYTRTGLVARIRAAGFTPLFASYAYCLVFPVVAAARLLRRLTRRRWPAEAGSDVFPLPAAVTGVFLAVQAVERALLRVTSLPIGSSVVCVARKGELVP